MDKPQRYDVFREMADAQRYRGGIILLCVFIVVSALIIAVTALLITNDNLYVHPEIAHPATIPVHWKMPHE